MNAQNLKPEWADAVNGSGLAPLDKRVVVRPDEVPEKIGLIHIPESVRDQKKFAMQTVTVVAVGELAWSEAKFEARQRDVDFSAPAPGERVRIGKYTGDSFDGPDGKRYILLNDEDVLGRLEE